PAAAAQRHAQGLRPCCAGPGHRGRHLRHAMERAQRRTRLRPHVAADPGHDDGLRRLPDGHDGRGDAALGLAVANRPRPRPPSSGTGSMKTVLILCFLGLIVYQLGAGLYYMLVDTGGSKRTVNALTKRIGLSVLLIALVA